jgi:dsDNA-specific endonuclease/ATPase MutS2
VRRYDDVKHKGNPFIIKHREYDNIIVVDLHADQLLDSVAGMNNANILDYQMNKFREVMNANIKNRGQKIVFIHGKGEGVLRHSIISDLSFRYKKCHYQDASFQEYGYGATQVTIN